MKHTDLHRIFAVLAATFLTAAMLQAQNRTITGIVLDSDGFPLIGAGVMIDGQTTGVITDSDGAYSIQVAPGNVLSFSYIGYVTQKVSTDGKTTIDVTLAEDALFLDNVVVVGYGSQKKSHLTGSISSVKTEGLADIPVSDVTQVLQGKVAGLQIHNYSSEAGYDPSITIRGAGSISASSEPLVIIDGFPSLGGLNSVNAADIESIEVLKDAASAAIYGSRAAGGVILITTKAGNPDKPKYNVKLTSGIKHVYKTADVYDMYEYMDIRFAQKDLYDKWASANGQKPLDIESEEAMLYVGEGYTDWQDYALRLANFSNVQASVAGGTEKSRYYISGNYNYDQGTMVHNWNKKVNVRAKIDAKLSDRVEVGVQFAPQYQQKETPGEGYQAYIRTAGWMPVYHTQQTVDMISKYDSSFSKKPGDFAQTKDWTNITYTRPDGSTFKVKNIWSSSDNSPIEMNEKTEDIATTYSMTGNGYINIKIADGLTFKTSDGFNLRYMEKNKFCMANRKKAGQLAENSYSNSLYVNLLSENMLTYQKEFGKHNLSLLAAYTAEYTKINRAAIYGQFANDYIKTLNAATAIGASSKTYTNQEEIAMQSVLARATYSYDDKYLFSASWRRDGSSKFGPDNRWGNFPSVSAGWRVSQEPWMKNIGWLSNLKLRASYGVTGNDNITNYAPYNTLSLVQYQTGSALAAGYTNTSTTLGNRALGWEQTNQSNVGIDFSALQGRIVLTADAYLSQTKALLLQQTIPSITGFDSYWNNIGKVQNKGIEVQIDLVPVRSNDFEWLFSFNIASNANKVLDLGGVDQIISFGEREEAYIAKVGYPLIQFYQFKTDGVYRTSEEAAAAGFEEAVPGGLKVVENVVDGVLDDKDRSFCGTPYPDFTYGFTNTFTWKNLDLSFTFQGQHGGEYIEGDVNFDTSRKYVKNWGLKNQWIGEDPTLWGDGKTPSVISTKTGINWMYTDYCIRDNSYISLRDVTLGYTLSNKAAKKIGLSGLRLFASGQNLFFYWPDKRIGMANPEGRYKSGDEYKSPLVDGYQRGAFPLQYTVTLGLDINF